VKLVREEDIRTQIEAWLKQQGISVEREVVCGNGIRADLVTPDMVIEVKKYLNRGALYQAYGQGAAYQKLLKKPKLLIVGLAPVTEAKYQEAQRIAENLCTDAVKVVFLDQNLKSTQTALAASFGNGAVQPALQPVPPAPTVRLPFEPKTDSAEATPASEPSTAGKPAQNAPQPSAMSGFRLTGKDLLPLLLLILLFLWIKAAYWQQEQLEPDPPAPVPELTPPTDLSPAPN
jgi:hypothetical protein